LTTNRKITANRENARLSTGPRTAEGRRRAAKNARRFGLSLPVSSNPEFSLAVEIAGPDASAKIQELASRVAEADTDLYRVRSARHGFVIKQLNELSASSAARSPPQQLTRAVPDLTVILSRELKGLAAFDRYERRARSRRKLAVRAFDQARRLETVLHQPVRHIALAEIRLAGRGHLPRFFTGWGREGVGCVINKYNLYEYKLRNWQSEAKKPKEINRCRGAPADKSPWSTRAFVPAA
jgi:hypothetical protein